MNTSNLVSMDALKAKFATVIQDAFVNDNPLYTDILQMFDDFLNRSEILITAIGSGLEIGGGFILPHLEALDCDVFWTRSDADTVTVTIAGGGLTVTRQLKINEPIGRFFVVRKM